MQSPSQHEQPSFFSVLEELQRLDNVDLESSLNTANSPILLVADEPQHLLLHTSLTHDHTASLLRHSSSTDEWINELLNSGNTADSSSASSVLTVSSPNVSALSVIQAKDVATQTVSSTGGGIAELSVPAVSSSDESVRTAHGHDSHDTISVSSVPSIDVMISSTTSDHQLLDRSSVLMSRSHPFIWSLSSDRVTASSLLKHAQGVVEGLISKPGCPCIFKLGVTKDPNHRWFNSNHGYSRDHDGWTIMILFAKLQDKMAAGLLESFLIQEYGKRPGCRNQAPGGEGLSDHGPFFLYVVFKQLEARPVPGHRNARETNV